VRQHVNQTLTLQRTHKKRNCYYNRSCQNASI